MPIYSIPKKGDMARFNDLMNQKYALKEQGADADSLRAKAAMSQADTAQFSADTNRQRLPFEETRSNAAMVNANANKFNVEQQPDLIDRRNKGLVDLEGVRGTNELAQIDRRGENKVTQIGLEHANARETADRKLAGEFKAAGATGDGIDRLFGGGGLKDINPAEKPVEYNFTKMGGGVDEDLNTIPESLVRTDSSGRAQQMSLTQGAPGLGTNFNPNKPTKEEAAYLQYLHDNGKYDVLDNLKKQYSTAGQ